jgi:hypothetical protein
VMLTVLIVWREWRGLCILYDSKVGVLVLRVIGEGLAETEWRSLYSVCSWKGMESGVRDIPLFWKSSLESFNHGLARVLLESFIGIE